MEYIVQIEKMDHQGRGIAYTDGIITFIPNTLVGEKVKIKIVKNNKKIRIGEVLELIEKDSKRIKPVCKYYESCGGCNIMHIPYEEELIYKENKVKEIIKKFTDIDIEKVNKIIPNNNYLNYRNKATFQVKEKIGYYKEKTYDIIPLDNCLIVDKKINEILNKLKEINLDGIYQIVIRVSSNDSMVIFKVNKDINLDIALLKNFISTIVVFNKKYEVLYGNGYIVEQIGDYNFIISPDSFFQINTSGAYNLYSKVLEYVKESDYLLDLYCGTGTIGIFLSSVCKRVLGVEINKYAIEDANKNKEMNRIKNINFVCKDASLFNDKLCFDTIVVDPPRSGLDTKTLEYILDLNVNKIVYVSCDPVTLARDLNILKEKYEIIEITPVDMFSRTHHVECVCVLKQKQTLEI